MKFILGCLISSLVVVTEAQWDDLYDKNGTDWSNNPDWKACGSQGQSPIDLRYDFEKVYIQDDMQFSGYWTGWDRLTKVWDDQHAYQLQAVRDKVDGQWVPATDMVFSSKYGAQKGWSAIWNPLEFHFHVPSEHTIEGKQFDMEIHFVHTPAADATQEQKATLGSNLVILLDTKNYDKEVAKNETINQSIRDMFHRFVNDAWEVPIHMRGKMEIMYKHIDFNNRWAYEGSLSTPPCSRIAYYNIAKKVYKLHPEDLEKIKRGMIDKNEKFFKKWADDGLEDPRKIWYGNIRNVQPLDTQKPVIIVNSADPTAVGDSPAAIAAYRARTLFISFLVLFILTLLGLLCACTLLCQTRKYDDDKDGAVQLTDQGDAQNEADEPQEKTKLKAENL